MKPAIPLLAFLVLGGISALLLACEPASQDVVKNSHRVSLGNGRSITVHTIVLDGNEYYATGVHGGYSICPKLAPKTSAK